MLHESASKCLILCGDAFPVHYKYNKQIEKGDYVVKLFVRHERIDALEKLKDLSIHLRQSISSFSQDVYSSFLGVLKGNKKSGALSIQKQTSKSYYLHPINEDKLPKGVQNGNFLVGDITFFKDSSISKVDKHRILYHINSLSKKENNKKNDQSKASSALPCKKKSDSEKLKDSIRDTQVSFVSKYDFKNSYFKSIYGSNILVYRRL
jgi:tripeptidyl-peptidase-2